MLIKYEHIPTVYTVYTDLKILFNKNIFKKVAFPGIQAVPN